MKSFTSTSFVAALALSSSFVFAQDLPPADLVAPPRPAVPALEIGPLEVVPDVLQLAQAVERDVLTSADQFRVAADQYKAAVAEADVGLALAQVGAEPMLGRFFSKAPTRTLVIQTSNADRAEQAELEEDLAVMAHILEKAVGKDRASGTHATAMNINVYSLMSGSQPIQGLYLEGYGALFLMNAKFPLLAPPAKKEEPKEEEPQDTTWNEARRELFGPRGGDFFNKQIWKASPATEEYDAEKVTKLKDALLESLKNASNVRRLKPDEFVTVTVVGPSGAFVVRGKARTAASTGVGLEPRFDSDLVRADGRGDTVLTIRAKKSDVDAFAKGKLSLDEFRAKANIQTYTSGSSSRSAQLFHAPDNVRATVQRRQAVPPKPAVPAWPEAPAAAPSPKF